MSRGRNITALGVLYDFTGNAQNTTVQNVEDMVKEPWVRLGNAPSWHHTSSDVRLVLVHGSYRG